ncbi:octopamine receptor-like [Lytechinus pictus]|uniref:octopamine receptor-like n=1 Tax=Lytechinus pictus TaxID=7653 RepID=UPI00240E8FDC|nr:octopamine receptor-like [Lytechinus pictus]
MAEMTEGMVFEMDSGNDTVMSESFGQPTFAVVIFVTIGFVGMIGNALVCIVIASTLAWSKSGTTNLLILNQAVVDTSTSFILILSYTLPYPFIRTAGGWPEFVCRMWVPHTLLWMLFVVSTYNLCMMSLERYIAVAYPVAYSTRFKKETSLLMILFCWILAPLLHYYYPIAYDYNDGGVCRKRGDPLVVATIGVLIFVWEFFIPFIIMAVVYSRIVYLLRRQQLRVRAVNTNPGQPEPRSGHLGAQASSQPHIQVSLEQNVASRSEAAQGHHQGNSPQQRRRAPSETVRRNVTVTLLSVFVMYVVCWMPNHLTFLQFGLGGPLNLSGAWYYITLILAYLNMSINPFIYALKYKLFREGFRRLFCDRCYKAAPERRNFTEHSSLPPRPVPTVSGSDRGLIHAE